jgi:dipeptidyl aminopeptidase/acylaminoacyl peptidase
LSLPIQYWTSRGFAVVDVNYAGSTGYGTAYRRALDGAWGVADVEDCNAAATYLVNQGLADPDRIAITGGSAGGYTTLCALTFTDRFRAGASHYGISDLKALYDDTHKFESRYLDRLIGPLETSGEIIRARSPIHHLDLIDCPVILFQGMDDKVVPPNQAELMAAALRAKGLPVALLTFEGEGHGFRQGATIRRTLEAELWFYGRIFGFEPADAIEPVEIDNWPAAGA